MTAWSGLLTTLLTVGLLIAAVWAGQTAVQAMRASKVASDAAREANEQARRDSIEQTRPYVDGEVLPSLVGPRLYDLRISNVGSSAARDLRFEFDNWPDPIDEVAEKIKVLFDTPRTLPSNASIRAFWRMTGDFTDGTLKQACQRPENFAFATLLMMKSNHGMRMNTKCSSLNRDFGRSRKMARIRSM